MKKVFVEPEIKRIELNMKENIASSPGNRVDYSFTTGLFDCTVVTTGKKVFELNNTEAEVCLVNPKAKIGGIMFYPEDEVKPYFRR